MNVLELSEQEIQRRNSLEELRKLGINPYPAAEYKVDAYSDDIKSNFNEEEKREVCIAGRLMGKRIMGKASFAELMDSKGRIQVYITRDDICPDEDKTFYNTVFKKLLDLGDFIGVKGFVFRTQTGEISVHAQEIVFLSKSLKPLPVVKEKDGVTYDAFNDPELRYRQRYVDLLVNPGVKDIFMKRTQVIKTMREYFDENGYTEVETPILQPIPGGASARPFITHHNSLDIDLYLRIATELYLKRLIVGGFEGVYEIGKNFRNEGMDRSHNPEFTCMELYVQYKDYNWMMSFTEKLLERICVAVMVSPKAWSTERPLASKLPSAACLSSKLSRRRRATTLMERLKTKFATFARSSIWKLTTPWARANSSMKFSENSVKALIFSLRSSPITPLRCRRLQKNTATIRTLQNALS